MNALMVRCNNGFYSIPDATAVEDWDEVQALADQVDKIEALKGWGDYTAAYAVQVDGCTLIYFVSEND